MSRNLLLPLAGKVVRPSRVVVIALLLTMALAILTTAAMPLPDIPDEVMTAATTGL